MPYPFPPVSGSSSPWGPVQSVEALGPDAVFVTTASHGGLRLSDAALERLPPALQATPFSVGGWFEEDCDWALPYLALRLDAFEVEPARGVKLRAAAMRAVERFHPQHVGVLGVVEARGGHGEG